MLLLGLGLGLCVGCITSLMFKSSLKGSKRKDSKYQISASSGRGAVVCGGGDGRVMVEIKRGKGGQGILRA